MILFFDLMEIIGVGLLGNTLTLDLAGGIFREFLLAHNVRQNMLVLRA